MPNSLIQRIYTQLSMNNIRLSSFNEKYLTEKTLIYDSLSNQEAKQKILTEIHTYLLDHYCINLLLDEYVIYAKAKHAFWHNLLDWVPTREGASGMSLQDGQKIILDLGLPELELIQYEKTQHIKPF